MDDSIAHPPLDASALAAPAWKSWASAACALLVAALFLSSGLWKITDPIGWSARIVQMQVPPVFAMPLTLALGVANTFAGALILVPRFRRWGALLAGFLLICYMGFVALNYNTLRGEECSCFPWLKRSIGPGFFVGDGLMLLAAFAAGRWASPSHSRKSAALMLAAIAVFAAVSYGHNVLEQTGVKAPESVSAEGKPFSLAQGRVFLYFYDPECMHCFEAAQRMAKWKWKGVRILVAPTRVPQFARQFLNDTGLDAPVASDVETLRGIFKFNDPPYAVALEAGRQKEAFIAFSESEPETGLRKLGWIE
jgi:uncharacterized membrane protein YphA (DoxX/SURF4 family)